jgi:integrase
MALSETKIRNAKPKDKPYKLTDGEGLFLLISPPGKKSPNGGKWWRFKYRFGGKEKLLSFGTYPEVSLAAARDKRTEARKMVANGIDPGEDRKTKKMEDATKAMNTFEAVALEWYGKNEPVWSLSHAITVKTRLEKYVFPAIGNRPISEIKAPEVLKLIQALEARGVIETAYRTKVICGQVFRYATATGRADGDPTAALRGALSKRKVRHHASIVDPKEVAGLLRAIDGYGGTYVVKAAFKLAPLLFLRPGELRNAEWSEFDLDSAEWNIPIERMKLRQQSKEARKGEKHLVPLSRQAVNILSQLKKLTGNSKYVFPNARSIARPMSNEAINAALERMGYKGEMTGHGFRAMARTILDEVLDVPPDIIEHQLAHAVKDPLGRAYNRTTKLPQRKEMMQLWADYLDGLKAGAKVIPLKKAE